MTSFVIISVSEISIHDILLKLNLKEVLFDTLLKKSGFH